jgi:hypothetical protein
MSDINLDFIVANNNINFTVAPNDITFTPSDIQLSFFGGGLGVPGGSNTQLQYNNGGLLGGVANTSFNGSVLSLGSPNNISITGGSANYALQTDGAGNLSWGSIANANYASFANIANIANLANSLNALSITNVVIGGGLNGYYLQTDGTGNLTWSAGTGGGGNGSPGGANTQIQFNDAGAFGGNVGFTFDKINGNVSLPNNLSVIGDIGAGNITANYFIGNGSLLTGINVVQSNLVNGTSNINVEANGNVTTSVAGNSNITIVTGTGSNINGYLTINGTTSLQQAKEKVNANATGSTGTVNFDILSSAILLKTANASSNFDINVRGNSTTTLNSVMSNNESLTCTYINKLGASTYYATSLLIDSVAQSVKWDTAGGPPSSGTTLGYDAYTFNILKTAANTYTVFGTRLGYL